MSSFVFTTTTITDVRITHFNLQGFTGSSTTITSTTTTTERIMPPPSFSMSSGSPSPLRRQKRFDLSDLVDNADALYKPETFLTRQLWKGKHLLLRRSFVYTFPTCVLTCPLLTPPALGAHSESYIFLYTALGLFFGAASTAFFAYVSYYERNHRTRLHLPPEVVSQFEQAKMAKTSGSNGNGGGDTFRSFLTVRHVLITSALLVALSVVAYLAWYFLWSSRKSSKGVLMRTSVQSRMRRMGRERRGGRRSL